MATFKIDANKPTDNLKSSTVVTRKGFSTLNVNGTIGSTPILSSYTAKIKTDVSLPYNRFTPIYIIYTETLGGKTVNLSGNAQDPPLNNSVVIRNTLNATAIREGRLNLLTGKFESGYPADSTTSICLGSNIFRYNVQYKDRASVADECEQPLESDYAPQGVGFVDISPSPTSTQTPTPTASATATATPTPTPSSSTPVLATCESPCAYGEPDLTVAVWEQDWHVDIEMIGAEIYVSGMTPINNNVVLNNLVNGFDPVTQTLTVTIPPDWDIATPTAISGYVEYAFDSPLPDMGCVAASVTPDDYWVEYNGDYAEGMTFIITKNSIIVPPEWAAAGGGTLYAWLGFPGYDNINPKTSRADIGFPATGNFKFATTINGQDVAWCVYTTDAASITMRETFGFVGYLSSWGLSPGYYPQIFNTGRFNVPQDPNNPGTIAPPDRIVTINHGSNSISSSGIVANADNGTHTYYVYTMVDSIDGIITDGTPVVEPPALFYPEQWTPAELTAAIIGNEYWINSAFDPTRQQSRYNITYVGPGMTMTNLGFNGGVNFSTTLVNYPCFSVKFDSLPIPSPSPTPTQTRTPTRTPTNTPPPSNSPTPSRTPSSTPASNPTPTPTPSISAGVYGVTSYIPQVDPPYIRLVESNFVHSLFAGSTDTFVSELGRPILDNGSNGQNDPTTINSKSQFTINIPKRYIVDGQTNNIQLYDNCPTNDSQFSVVASGLGETVFTGSSDMGSMYGGCGTFTPGSTLYPFWNTSTIPTAQRYLDVLASSGVTPQPFFSVEQPLATIDYSITFRTGTEPYYDSNGNVDNSLDAERVGTTLSGQVYALGSLPAWEIYSDSVLTTEQLIAIINDPSYNLASTTGYKKYTALFFGDDHEIHGINYSRVKNKAVGSILTATFPNQIKQYHYFLTPASQPLPTGYSTFGGSTIYQSRVIGSSEDVLYGGAWQTVTLDSPDRFWGERYWSNKEYKLLAPITPRSSTNLNIGFLKFS